jgi:PAS domain S-box-containing protein
MTANRTLFATAPDHAIDFAATPAASDLPRERFGPWPKGDIAALHFGVTIKAPTAVQHLVSGESLTKSESVLQQEPFVGEPALERAERLANLLASIVESSDDAIISKNLDGVITSWNRAAERIFGYLAPEAIGQPITLVIPENRQSEEREILTRIRRGERIDYFETVRRRRDGSLINVSLSVSPVKDAHGNVVGASKIARDSTEQKRSQEQITILAREAEHRSKNILSNIQAIINLSQSDTTENLKEVISGRIQALANVNSLFVETRWIGAEVSAIAKQELAPYLEESNDKRVRIEGLQTVLNPTTAQAIAVVLHELATNASKYGALSSAKGQIRLTWLRSEDGQIVLHWTELGGPSVNAPERKGFGSRLIEGTISHLGGTALFEWREEGLVCKVTVPM